MMQCEEDKILKRIEIERQRADEMERVRKEYEDKVQMLRYASIEREMKMNDQVELNKTRKACNKQAIYGKADEI